MILVGSHCESSQGDNLPQGDSLALEKGVEAAVVDDQRQNLIEELANSRSEANSSGGQCTLCLSIFELG